MKTLTLISILLFYLEPAVRSAEKRFKYPEARKADVVEDYHGTRVADPYRWMEDPGAPETRAWVDAENELTRSYIDSLPGRAKIEARLTKLWNYPKYGIPDKEGGRYFFSKNDGLQNQSVLYWAEGLSAEPRVLIDPNRLSEDGTAALTGLVVSDDGKRAAYAISKSGSDWQEIRIRTVDTGQDYPDVIRWCKFASVAWRRDGTGFWYNRLPTPGTVPPEDENNYSRVYWHQLGTAQEKDPLVFEMPEKKEWGFFPGITEDGQYLYLDASHGTDDRNGFYYREAASAGAFVKLVELGEARFTFIGNVGSTFYFNTSLGAPRGRIVAIDVKRPERSSWKEILPEQTDVLDTAVLASNHLLLKSMHNAHELLKLYDLSGKLVRGIELPTVGAISGISARQEDSEVFFAFTSFLYPTTIYRYDFKTDRAEVFRKPQIDFDPAQFVTRQVFYPSKDGTKVSMFLTHKKTLTFDGQNPVLLYGYGGFNIPETPAFSLSRLVWLEAGGVYAVANLRGGSEYGDEWHRAGMLERKQNVFDDFIAAAEYLIENRVTEPKKLAINGGSNGGLLVTACLLQRPDLFGAAVAQVPVTDMLRYHKFTVGRYWTVEYGNAEENPDHFKFLIAYSPLHNVKSGVAYPPTLVTSADTDDRVVPMHAKKFVATLQAADAGVNPILLRVETKAGHGTGKPTSKTIEELSDILAFLFKALGMGEP